MINYKLMMNTNNYGIDSLNSNNYNNYGGNNSSRDYDRNMHMNIPNHHLSASGSRDMDYENNSYGNNSQSSGYYNNGPNYSTNQMRYGDNQDMLPGRSNMMPPSYSTNNMNRLKSMSNPSLAMNMNPHEPSQQAQQFRHARRIYLGGIPPNYADEDALKNFLNNVISKGLGEENDYSYVVSIYINQKKCFAFVELKSVELATACLDLDGIIYKKVILKVLRAKEYQPELLPSNFLNKSLRFDLTSFAFGCPATPAYNPTLPDAKDYSDLKLESIIQFSNLSAVTRGSVVIVGFPFDENVKTKPNMPINNNRVSGSINTPKIFRNCIHKTKYGSVENPEFSIDLSLLKIFDVGDVLAGKNSEETKLNLTATVNELVVRGGVPFIIGGSADQTYYNALGLMSGYGNNSIGFMSISAQLDTRLLDEPKFMSNKSSSMSMNPSCEGRFIKFGVQGSQCTIESSQYVTDRAGQIVWLNKHLRSPAAKLSVPLQFKKTLNALGVNAATGAARPVFVSLDAGSLCCSVVPLASSSTSPVGLSMDEVLDIAMIAGANPNVVMFEIVEFNPVSEESRYNLILPEIFYKFSIGLASRSQQTSSLADKTLMQSFEDGSKNSFLFDSSSPPKSLLPGNKLVPKSTGTTVSSSEEGSYSMGESILNNPSEYSSFLDSQMGSSNNFSFPRSKSDGATPSLINMGLGLNNNNKSNNSFFPGFNMEESSEITNNNIYSENINELNLGSTSFSDNNNNNNNNNNSSDNNNSILSNRLMEMSSHNNNNYNVDDIIDNLNSAAGPESNSN